MADSYVSKVLASSNGGIVAIGIYDKPSQRHRLQTWNWRTSTMLTEFETVFDGCDRIAISSIGDVLFAGNWQAGENGGVAAYDTTSGSLLWHRTDIFETQRLHYSHSNEAVWCSTEKSPLQSLDAQTEKTLFAWETIRDAFDSPFDARWLAERETDYVLVGEPSVAIPRESFSLLHAVFSPDSVCLTEATGPVRCLESNSGEERWRYSSEQGHVIQLSYQPNGFMYGVLFLSQEGEDSKLVRFALDSGACEVLYHEAERGPFAWSIGPGVLITRTGAVISLETGQSTGQLALILGDPH
jgi:outer membrane protein assembly factor BamB